MKSIVCEMCGSNDLVKNDGMFVCQNCGTKYTTEEAKKLLVEVSGKVKIDSSEELTNLYALARRAKDDGNSENAQKYYEQIIVKDPSSWEANFYTTFYQSMNCTISEIGLASNRVSNCENTVFNLIKENVVDLDKQRHVVNEVAEKLIFLSDMLFNVYKNFYDGIASPVKETYNQSYANSCSAARDVVYNAGNLIVQIFGDEYGDIAANCWKTGVIQHNILNGIFKDKKLNASIIKEYNDKILKYDSSYKPPRTNMRSDGCYVATAVYGSYDCPEVWVLRRFRDYVLARKWYGRIFIRVYYAVSPELVKWFGRQVWFTEFWKTVLDEVIRRLKTRGFSVAPYKDKNW